MKTIERLWLYRDGNEAPSYLVASAKTLELEESIWWEGPEIIWTVEPEIWHAIRPRLPRLRRGEGPVEVEISIRGKDGK